MSGMSANMISVWESSMLRLREKSNKFCSLLCTYCLLDVIISLVIVEGLTIPPLHKKMNINLSKNEVHGHLDLCCLLLMTNREIYILLKTGLQFCKNSAITLQCLKQAPKQMYLLQTYPHTNCRHCFSCIPMWMLTKVWWTYNLRLPIFRSCYNIPPKKMCIVTA